MRMRALPLAIAAALCTSACYSTADDLTVSTSGQTVASVSQDAGLSLAAGAAPGTESGFFYNWPRRDYEQRVQAAQLRERELEQQVGTVP